MIEFYQDNKDEWRWRVIAINGRTVGSSSEGFYSKQNAQRNAQCLAAALKRWDWR